MNKIAWNFGYCMPKATVDQMFSYFNSKYLINWTDSLQVFKILMTDWYQKDDCLRLVENNKKLKSKLGGSVIVLSFFIWTKNNFWVMKGSWSNYSLLGQTFTTLDTCKASFWITTSITNYKKVTTKKITM